MEAQERRTLSQLISETRSSSPFLLSRGCPALPFHDSWPPPPYLVCKSLPSPPLLPPLDRLSSDPCVWQWVQERTIGKYFLHVQNPRWASTHSSQRRRRRDSG